LLFGRVHSFRLPRVIVDDLREQARSHKKPQYSAQGLPSAAVTVMAM
jgi:hypothetical protein